MTIKSAMMYMYTVAYINYFDREKDKIKLTFATTKCCLHEFIAVGEREAFLSLI